MMSSQIAWLPLAMAAVHILGLTSVWFVRASEGSHRETWCQCFFLGCLACVAVATIISMTSEMGMWALSGGTLGVMVVAATWEPRRHEMMAREFKL